MNYFIKLFIFYFEKQCCGAGADRHRPFFGIGAGAGAAFNSVFLQIIAGTGATFVKHY